jgi:hypothetical protein
VEQPASQLIVQNGKVVNLLQGKPRDSAASPELAQLVFRRNYGEERAAHRTALSAIRGMPVGAILLPRVGCTQEIITKKPD